MEKFRVGDTVIGNAQASIHYMVTKEGYIAEVVKLRGDRMLIQKLGDQLESPYDVHQNYFDLFPLFPEDAET